nr:uncharacterized protein LOC101950017 isoform X2 [Chrysemys picta bellii]XP_042702340.1 uncharacterized protein LOC101950017 isoform X2 [Chrysemys picta bellii]
MQEPGASASWLGLVRGAAPSSLTANTCSPRRPAPHQRPAPPPAAPRCSPALLGPGQRQPHKVGPCRRSTVKWPGTNPPATASGCQTGTSARCGGWRRGPRSATSWSAASGTGRESKAATPGTWGPGCRSGAPWWMRAPCTAQCAGPGRPSWTPRSGWAGCTRTRSGRWWWRSSPACGAGSGTTTTVEKAKASYHRACRKEHAAAGREQLAPGAPPLAPDRQRALREERQRHTLETHKERQHYEQALAELTRASPRYVEEMESVFEQGQEFEQRRIDFLKEALTALQRRLDPTAHPG